MTTQPQEIGSINSDVDTQRRLATASQFYRCPLCGINHAHLLINSSEIIDGDDMSTLRRNNHFFSANDIMKTTAKKRPTSVRRKKKVDKGLFQYFGGLSLKSLLLASSLLLILLFQTGKNYWFIETTVLRVALYHLFPTFNLKCLLYFFLLYLFSSLAS